MGIKTWSYWPDSICCCIEKQAMLMGPAHSFDRKLYGIAHVQLDLNLDEAKQLLMDLKKYVDDFEFMDSLAKEDKL